MEIIVSRNALLAALNNGRWLIGRNAMQVFENFIFDVNDDGETQVMKVNASNGEIWFRQEVAVELKDADSERHSFAVYASDILRPIRALDEQPLRIVVSEYQLSVIHEIGSFRVPLANNAEEYHEMRHKWCGVINGSSVLYEAPGLRSILSRCSFAMSNDELRPVMNGLYMNLTKDYADYVSSDGHKLVRVRKKPLRGDGCFSCILPARVVKTLLHILPKTGDVYFECQDKVEKEEKYDYDDGDGKKQKTRTTVVRKAQGCFFIDDSIFLNFTPIDGAYPKYWSVIPESHNFEMTIDRKALVKSVDRLSLFAPTSELLEMNISKESVELRTNAPDYETDGEETLPCEFVRMQGVTDENLSIGFKASNLSATLKALSSENVIFHLIDSRNAIIIMPKPQPDVEDVTMLLMPMLIND